MSGELILENGGWWKDRLPAAAVTALIEALLLWQVVPWMVRRQIQGVTLHVATAVLVLVLWWALYPLARGHLAMSSAPRTLTWGVTPDTLTLGTAVIPLDTIKMVHCWANRSALGTAAGGWTVNIETTGKNYVLRSLPEGGDAERSARLLRELVCALGYEGQWPQ